MLAIHWHDGLNVGVAFMDDDHAEAAAQINALAAAWGAERTRLMGRFIHHCREHFAREETMMEQTGFFALHCHQGEHSRVLAEFDAVLARLQAGDPQDQYFTKTLPGWLMDHRGSMDIVTAQFARSAGFT
jgi:hemerythrin